MSFSDGSDGDNDDQKELVDSVLRNPFAEHSHDSFTSAIRTRPAVRRRGSDGPSRAARNDHDPWNVSHARARTSDLGPVASTSQHPLGSPWSSNGNTTRTSVEDATRPHLKRLLSDLEPSPHDSGSDTDLKSGNLLASEKETEVIVHEILPKDSLAGVALKYGITLSDLRRANQLWASDSIHLRKVLYMPLEKARRAKEFKYNLIDSDSVASTSQHSLGSSWVGPHDNTTQTSGENATHLLSGLRIPPHDSEGDEEPARSGNPLLNEGEREVVVHEVLPKDSLSGIALRYRVSVEDLVRVNQLGASDSIHLRKVLYIPLENAGRAQEYRPAVMNSPIGSTASSPGRPLDVAQDDTTERARHKPPDQPAILRVPVSRLSFFPPPSSSSRKSLTMSHLQSAAFNRLPLPLAFSASNSPQRLASPIASSTSSPAPGSLPRTRSQTHNNNSGTFLSRFPTRTAALNRSNLIARLSSESASLSASTPSDDLEWGHEMDDIGHSPSPAASTGRPVSEEDPRVPFAPTSNVVASRSNRRAAGDNSVELAPYPRSSSSLSARTPTLRRGGKPVPPSAGPRPYHPDHPSLPSRSQAAVRTAQLEPSPVMQLPLRATSSKRR